MHIIIYYPICQILGYFDDPILMTQTIQIEFEHNHPNIVIVSLRHGP